MIGTRESGNLGVSAVTSRARIFHGTQKPGSGFCAEAIDQLLFTIESPNNEGAVAVAVVAEKSRGCSCRVVGNRGHSIVRHCLSFTERLDLFRQDVKQLTWSDFGWCAWWQYEVGR